MDTPNQNEQVDIEDVVVEYIELEADDSNDTNITPTIEKTPGQQTWAEEPIKEPAEKSAEKPTEEPAEEFDYQSAEMAGIDRKRNFIREIFTYLMIIAAAFLVSVFLSRFVIINTHIPSNSMEATISAGDRLIGYRMAYTFTKPQFGDIVIFLYPDDRSQTFIKRVIGVPGDVVEIINGELFINNHRISEDYIKEPMVGSFGPYEVPEHSYFVMGDNRNVSDDARFWENTYVNEADIIARAWFRYSPNFTNLWNQ